MGFVTGGVVMVQVIYIDFIKVCVIIYMYTITAP